jgi:poly(hydroxyalkanoate) depolymerase family esterase
MVKRYSKRPVASGPARSALASPRAMGKGRQSLTPPRGTLPSSTTTRGGGLASARTARRGRWRQTGYTKAKTQARPATRLDYALYVPNSVGATPVPLVVMLHGCNQTAREFAEGTRMNLVADREGFAVLYPQQSESSNAYRCWNWFEELAQAGGGEAALIAATIAQVSAQYPIDPSRVYVAGLSAGASMATILAIHYPHLIAAVGLHSGVVFGAAQTSFAGLGVMRHGALEAPENAVRSALGEAGAFGMPAVLIHGDRDPVVHPVNLAQLVAQFKVLNPSIAQMQPIVSSETQLEHAGALAKPLARHDYMEGEKSILRVYTIPELDHAWSGGEASSPFHSGDGPDASDLMWEFLEQHQRPRPG